jgi:Xaa-Pro dipeptidase
MAWGIREFEEKLSRIRGLMVREEIGNLLITTQNNFIWLTGGRPYINTGVEHACGEILITADKIYLLANNIEATRLVTEELAGLPLIKSEYSWWEATGRANRLRDITEENRVVTDSEINARFSSLRWNLTVEEQDRYLDTGKSVASALEEVAYLVKPGLTEREIADLIRQSAQARGVNPWVNLVAADERNYQYRHPLPTDRKLERYVMLVLTGQKHGLFAAASRLIHFGLVPADLQLRHAAVLKVDVAFNANTVPGKQVKDAFAAGIAAYDKVGFGDQWKFHHQGGMTGYNARDFRGTADCDVPITVNQAYAWNPSIAGVKSEDTFLIKENEALLLTQSTFPVIEVEYAGHSMNRPAILVR